MHLGLLLRIASVYTAVAGLAFMLAPQAFGTGAVPPDASDALIAHLRLFGGPFLGIAVLDWMARDAGPSPARNAIIAGNAVGFAAVAAMDLWAQVSGGREVTKVFAVVHLLFAAGFIWAGRKGWSARAS